MAIYTLMNPGDSPGVTTTALAVSYAWGGRALLAECDPKGGNVLQGFLTGRLGGIHGGLLELAMAIAHNSNPAVLWEHVIPLDQDAREWLLLPGIRDPRHAPQLDMAWDSIVDVLETATEDVVDVVADVGQIGRPDTPMKLIARSSLAVMLLRPTLRQITAAKPRLDALGRYVGTSVPVALALIGRGDYSDRQISQVLYGLPIIGRIPHDPRSAALLSDGKRSRGLIRVNFLMRAAARLAVAMREHAQKTAIADSVEEAG
ncbi:hypothetical protein [Thermoactinospora rubra]|uniref:hypothetical protein n=1 Tax=Thermoactinospora rubra TaxID=1088767 RepID=UPI001301FAE3|nr:hypothetical protein [Thermoactinospora rubra]